MRPETVRSDNFSTSELVFTVGIERCSVGSGRSSTNYPARVRSAVRVNLRKFGVANLPVSSVIYRESPDLLMTADVQSLHPDKLCISSLFIPTDTLTLCYTAENIGCESEKLTIVP